MSPPPTDLAVDARGLVKRFGSFTALHGLDIQIPRGAFYAYLGPNGAGKSTSLPSPASSAICGSCGACG